MIFRRSLRKKRFKTLAKKYMQLRSIGNFCDSNFIQKTIDFYLKHSILKKIFPVKAAERKDLSQANNVLKILAKKYLPFLVILTFVIASSFKKPRIFTWNTVFLRVFSRKKCRK